MRLWKFCIPSKSKFKLIQEYDAVLRRHIVLKVVGDVDNRVSVPPNDISFSPNIGTT